MLNASTPLLFESTDNHRVFSDPVNQAWLAVVNAIAGESFDVLARRYYLALTHLRSKGARPTLVGKLQVIADGAKQAAQGMLDLLIHRCILAASVLTDRAGSGDIRKHEGHHRCRARDRGAGNEEEWAPV